MLNKKTTSQEVLHWAGCGGSMGSGVFLFFKLNLAVMGKKKRKKHKRDRYC